ncbi:MAG: anion permease [Bacilli bacterium]|nr:anion permease [Bacilli bacterium]
MALKDNRIYRYIAIPICALLCFIGRFIPTFGGLSQDAVSVLFIFLGSLILWLTIGIDWPSLLTLFALGFLDNFKFSNVFSSSFGNFTWLFLLFTFICTYALAKTSLIKRIAIAFVDNRLAKKSGYLFILLFLTSVLLLGLFIAPTVLFVVILPILEEIFAVAKIEKGERIGKVMMMGLGFTVSISSGMTTIAHVFPVLAMSAAGIEVTPWAYMAMAIPVGLLVFAIMVLSFFFFAKPEVDKLKGLDVSALRKDLPAATKRDIITAAIFIVVIILWIVPSFFKEGVPEFYDAINQYTIAMPPLLGAIALCLIRVDGEPLVKVEEAFKKGVPWASLIMCAATLALGAALTNDAIGLKLFLQNNLGTFLSSLPAILILIVFAIWAALQTNVSSNMVTATLVATVAGAILSSPSIGLNLPAVASIIGLLASFAFATPPSMPHIAIVAGSGYANTKDVLLYGGLLMFSSIIVACLIGYPIASLVM